MALGGCSPARHLQQVPPDSRLSRPPAALHCSVVGPCRFSALSHATVLSKSSICSPCHTIFRTVIRPLNKRRYKQGPSPSTLLLPTWTRSLLSTSSLRTRVERSFWPLSHSPPCRPLSSPVVPESQTSHGRPTTEPHPFSPLNLPFTSNPFYFTSTALLHPVPPPLSALAFPSMEALSMLKYWRGDRGGRTTPPSATTTIIAASSSSETSGDNDDEGPFFDLEFAVPDDDDDDDDDQQPEREEEDGDLDIEEGSFSEDATDGEAEFDFTLSSTAAGTRTDPNLALSPSDDLFFKGRLVPLEPPASLHSESNPKPQFPGSFLKSATKFRVFLLGFKRPKSVPAGNDAGDAPAPAPAPQKHHQHSSKSFTVKFKVEEVPIVSLFTRDYSSRSGSGGKPQKLDDLISDDGVSSSDMKRFSRDVLQKYFKMIKPLYVRVSKRYGEKLRFSGQLSLGTGKSAVSHEGVGGVGEADSTSSTAGGSKNVQKQAHVNHIPAGLRVVCKHLGKSRSASAAVAASPPATSQCRRRDDSLLQQQDGIQSAILHCKRSLNGNNPSTDHEQGSLLPLPRSSSGPACKKSLNCEKGKEGGNERVSWSAGGREEPRCMYVSMRSIENGVNGGVLCGQVRDVGLRRKVVSMPPAGGAGPAKKEREVAVGLILVIPWMATLCFQFFCATTVSSTHHQGGLRPPPPPPPSS
ncbi:hypothetical protein H6P81_011635 [Aristolochia fimbriata]|uniref:Membrane-associated kinase regulator 2 n=1 Tax=Aristolochia fimbriata TaxID=158543 RepID=A0AAV7E9H5_ARIFI|nr:hypothetical protein H6P81_011635 [Aristolochia fimbriata]